MSILEVLMIVCFGLAWPINLYNSWKSKSTKGKNLLFMSFIVLAYVFGILNKLLVSVDNAIYFYCLNEFMVLADYILYFCTVKALFEKSKTEKSDEICKLANRNPTERNINVNYSTSAHNLVSSSFEIEKQRLQDKLELEKKN